MTGIGEIEIVKIADEFHKCPACGYEYGFHTSFLSAYSDKSLPIKSTRNTYRVILICPECGARYDIGWKISFDDDTLVPKTVFIKPSE